jgi:hypothetical protein
MSFGACDCYWDETDDFGCQQMMQRLITELIYDDIIPVAFETLSRK